MWASTLEEWLLQRGQAGEDSRTWLETVSSNHMEDKQPYLPQLPPLIGRQFKSVDTSGLSEWFSLQKSPSCGSYALLNLHYLRILPVGQEKYGCRGSGKSPGIRLRYLFTNTFIQPTRMKHYPVPGTGEQTWTQHHQDSREGAHCLRGERARIWTI